MGYPSDGRRRVGFLFSLVRHSLARRCLFLCKQRRLSERMDKFLIVTLFMSELVSFKRVDWYIKLLIIVLFLGLMYPPVDLHSNLNVMNPPVELPLAIMLSSILTPANLPERFCCNHNPPR